MSCVAQVPNLFRVDTIKEIFRAGNLSSDQRRNMLTYAEFKVLLLRCKFAEITHCVRLSAQVCIRRCLAAASEYDDAELPAEVLQLREILAGNPILSAQASQASNMATRGVPRIEGISAAQHQTSAQTSRDMHSGRSIPTHVPLSAREETRSRQQPRGRGGQRDQFANKATLEQKQAALEFKRKKKYDRALKEQQDREHERKYRQRIKEVFVMHVYIWIYA